MATTPKSGKAPEGKGAGNERSEIKYPRRTARRRRTRAAILEAADDHFRKDGYAGTTMQAIADSADVHVTTLFMHFSTKADLVLSLVEARIDTLRRQAFEARGKTSFFDFFRAEALQQAGDLSGKVRPGPSFWNALRTDSELAFARAAFEADQAEIFARFVAEEYEIDREQDYRADLVAVLMFTAAKLAHRKWIESGKALDPVSETSVAIDIAEPAARKMIGLRD